MNIIIGRSNLETSLY